MLTPISSFSGELPVKQQPRQLSNKSSIRIFTKREGSEALSFLSHEIKVSSCGRP